MSTLNMGLAKNGKSLTDAHRRNIGNAMSGTTVVFNLDTREISRIPTTLYHSQKDRYLHVASKTYKVEIMANRQ